MAQGTIRRHPVACMARKFLKIFLQNFVIEILVTAVPLASFDH
ncbi:MAG TPA: hypothetical protein VIQ29_24215 [Ancylobacter sp.]